VTTWNEIPYDPNADAQTKADEFDAQYAENGGGSEPEDNNPYSKENFNK
jgi:hypothetical protein